MLSNANAINLDQPKNLSFGTELESIVHVKDSHLS